MWWLWPIGVVAAGTLLGLHFLRKVETRYDLVPLTAGIACFLISALVAVTMVTARWFYSVSWRW